MAGIIWEQHVFGGELQYLVSGGFRLAQTFQLHHYFTTCGCSLSMTVYCIEFLKTTVYAT